MTDGSKYERVALAKDPNGPFAAMKDAALERLKTKADSWPIDDQVAVQTIIFELRYLRRKLWEEREKMGIEDCISALRKESRRLEIEEDDEEGACSFERAVQLLLKLSTDKS